MRTTPEPGSLKATLGELKKGTWLGDAQARAARRKSPWNLLLILALPVWLLLALAGLRMSRFVALSFTHGQPLAADLIWPSSIAPALVYVPLLLGPIPLAMVLVNYLVYYCVPPARRAMDAEDRAFPGTEYATQQPLMLRIALFAFPTCFALAVIGQLFL